MSTLKRTAIELIAKLPDGCTIEEIMYELNFVAQVLEGVKDAEDGKVITTEQLLDKVDKWRNLLTVSNMRIANN